MRRHWRRVDPLWAPIRITRHALLRWRARGGSGALTPERVREAARRGGVVWGRRACYVLLGPVVLVGVDDAWRRGGLAVVTVLERSGVEDG